MSVGTQIKSARKRAGLTQYGLAERLGVAVITIAQYESDKRQPRIDRLENIADALDVPIEYLLGIGEPNLKTPALKYQPLPENLASLCLSSGTEENLRRLRESKGMTLNELAEKTGIPLRYIRQYEDLNSIFTPPEEDILKFAEVFQMDPKYIIGIGDNQKRTVFQLRQDLRAQMEDAMDRLNLAGQQEAVKRVEEMSEIARYQK